MPKVIIKSFSVNSGFGESFSAMKSGIESGKVVTPKKWFNNKREEEMMRLNVNPYYIPSERDKYSDFANLCQVIDDALLKANMSHADISQKNVRVFLVGNGVRSNNQDYMAYLDRNDPEEQFYNPNIKKMQAKYFAQDVLSIDLLRKYKLAWPPISLYAASNSSMAGIQLAVDLIKGGGIDIALIVGFMRVSSQDVIFMGGQGIMGDQIAQPFSLEPSVCLPANCSSALVLSKKNKNYLHSEESIHITTSNHVQSGGIRGGNAFTADFRTIAECIQKTLLEADLDISEIDACFVHGNGVNSSDKAECMAIEKVFGKMNLPILSYKGQFGYYISCAGMVDIMFIHDALTCNKLLPMHAKVKLDETLSMAILSNCSPLSLKNGNILKLGVGLDGSVNVAIISRLNHEAAINDD
ncbi:hypothetical protein [Thorsellia kenyensis]|uniref:Beta-ketoacyl synthase C-terminal domain-containing protein n=1 Tax=Thorsellia kenyensis TaxID=1549888 RepID=A0ABV6CBD2_9GAMM